MQFLTTPISSMQRFFFQNPIPDKPTTVAHAKYPIQHSLSVAFSTRNSALIRQWMENTTKPIDLLESEINQLKPVGGWIRYAELDWRCFVDCPVVALLRYGENAQIYDCLQKWCTDFSLVSSREYLLRYVCPTPRFVPLVCVFNIQPYNPQYLFEDPHTNKFNSENKSYYQRFLPLLPGESLKEDIIEYTPTWDLRRNFKILVDGSDRYKQVIELEVFARLWGRVVARPNFVYWENKTIIRESVKKAPSLFQVCDDLWTKGICADLRPLFKSAAGESVPRVPVEEAKNNMFPLWRLFTSWVDPTLSFMTAIYLYIKQQNPIFLEINPLRIVNEEKAKEFLEKYLIVELYINVGYISNLYKERFVQKHIKDRLTKFSVGNYVKVVGSPQNAVRTALWLLLAAPYVIEATRNAIPHLEKLIEKDTKIVDPDSDAPNLILARYVVGWFKESNCNPFSTLTPDEFDRIQNKFEEFCKNAQQLSSTTELSAAIGVIQNLMFGWAHFIQPYPFPEKGVLDTSANCFSKFVIPKGWQTDLKKPFKLFANVYKSTKTKDYQIETELNDELVFGKKDAERELSMKIYTNSNHSNATAMYPTLI